MNFKKHIYISLYNTNILQFHQSLLFLILLELVRKILKMVQQFLLKTNSERALRKEGSLSWTWSRRTSTKLPRACNSNLLGSLAPSLFISPNIFPKGITFPLGSCLSRTNSRNSATVQTATVIFLQELDLLIRNPTFFFFLRFLFLPWDFLISENSAYFSFIVKCLKVNFLFFVLSL